FLIRWEKLVFQSNRSDLPQLWMLDTNGDEARQITFFKNGATSPSWSSDGKHIIFSTLLEQVRPNTFHELQLLAAKGYIVLYTNPRGSHGYGQKFVDACRADYGGEDYSDLMHAVYYALQHYHFIDEKRLGVTGGSYGGFMTNWIVSHTNRFKAAVTQRSISNWLSFYLV